MNEVILKVNNQDYVGWKDFQLTRSIEAASAAFSLQVSNTRPFIPKIGSECELWLNSHKALTGYIEQVLPNISATAFDIKVSGRDKVADIVDSSAIIMNSELLNIKFSQLLVKLLSPYGIQAKILDSSKVNTTLAKVSLNQESVFEVLEKQARKIGLFIYGDANGSIVIDKVGSKSAEASLKLGEGGNVLTASPQFDFTERFSEYIIKGQSQSNDNYGAKVASSISATAKDQVIGRPRTLVIVHSGSITKQEAIKKIQWEAAVRAAKSVQLSVRVYGWNQTDKGSLWNINEIADVDLKDAGFYGRMLIKSVDYSLSNDGAFTDLVLVDADAYLPEPEIVKPNKKNKKESFNFDFD